MAVIRIKENKQITTEDATQVSNVGQYKRCSITEVDSEERKFTYEVKDDGSVDIYDGEDLIDSYSSIAEAEEQGYDVTKID